MASGGCRANKPALLVINTHSRRGRISADAAADTLERLGLSLLRRRCDHRDALSALILDLKGVVGGVILGGGDGTLNAAAGALRETGLPLGILPLGTANDLARTLGIPPDIAQAAAIIAEGRTRRIDLGSVNGHDFFNVASMGLSVAITHPLTGVMKRRWGRLAYPIAAAAVMIGAGRFSAEIICHGRSTRTKSMQIAVGSGRSFGGGIVIEQDARIDDARLDVCSLEPRARWRLLPMAHAFRTGSRGDSRNVRRLRCSTVEVRTRRPRPVSTDGDITTHTRGVQRPAPGRDRVPTGNGGPGVSVSASCGILDRARCPSAGRGAPGRGRFPGRTES